MEYVKLDDVIALFMADIDSLTKDKNAIKGNDTNAQVSRAMADALIKHSSNLMTISMEKLETKNI